MNIVERRKVFYIFSGALMVMSIVAVGVWGLKLGIDFTGGSIIEIQFLNTRPDNATLRDQTATLAIQPLLFTPAGERGLFIRTRHLTEAEHQQLLTAASGVSSQYSLQEKRFDTIGPTIGRELRNRSVVSIFLVIILIVLYVTWAFRKVSRPVSSWKYGVVTVVALFHDVFVPTGLFAILGHFWGVEVDTLFVTALLTILGFSVHDTIVVFDRIRENLKNAKKSEEFEYIVNKSVHETLVRSLNTSLTVLLAMLAIFIFGGQSVRWFSFTLIVGVIFGTYSSIFIASPLLVTWNKIAEKQGKS